MKITKIKEDITSEIANSFTGSIAIDTEATGLQIPERDKLSLIQICDKNGNVFIIQPNKNNFKAPNLVSVLENDNIQNQIIGTGVADIACKYYIDDVEQVNPNSTEYGNLKNLVFSFQS